MPAKKKQASENSKSIYIKLTTKPRLKHQKYFQIKNSSFKKVNL